MPVFLYNNRTVYFYHIPKTGGTSIERACITSGIKCALLSTKLHGKKNEGFPCSPQHMHADIIKKLFPRGFFDYRMAVVRNPRDRVFSEYRQRVGPLAKMGKKAPSFDSWLANVWQKLKAYPYLLDNHLRPQVEFVDAETKVFKFEDGLADPINAIFTGLGCKPSLPLSEIPVKNSGVHLEFDISTESQGMIEDLYRCDFDVFGY